MHNRADGAEVPAKGSGSAPAKGSVTEPKADGVTASGKTEAKRRAEVEVQKKLYQHVMLELKEGADEGSGPAEVSGQGQGPANSNAGPAEGSKQDKTAPAKGSGPAEGSGQKKPETVTGPAEGPAKEEWSFAFKCASAIGLCALAVVSVVAVVDYCSGSYIASGVMTSVMHMAQPYMPESWSLSMC